MRNKCNATRLILRGRLIDYSCSVGNWTGFMMVVVVVSRKYGDCPRSVFYLFIRFRPSVYCVFIHLPLVVGIGLVASSTESSIRPRDERKEAVDCGGFDSVEAVKTPFWRWKMNVSV